MREIIICFFFVLCSSSSLQATPPKPVPLPKRASPEIRKNFEEVDSLFRTPALRNNAGKSKGSSWFVENSYLSRIFSNPANYSDPIYWIEGELSSYLPGKITSRLHKEFLSTNRDYKTSKNQMFNLMILVPHPRYKQARDLGLVQEFRVRESPSRKIIYDQQKSLKNGFDIRILMVENEGARVLINGEKGSLVTISTTNYQESTVIEDFAETLNLIRFNAKLNN